MTPRARARMTAADKLALRLHSAANPRLTQQDLAQWATKTFQLPTVPCRATLSRILNSAEPTTVPNRPKQKTQHRVTSADLEDKLIAWIRRCEQHKLPVVTGATVVAKAEKLRASIRHRADPLQRTALDALVFSQGWLSRFQKRHNLSSKRAHGEAASVCAGVVEEGRKKLQDVTQGYERRDVFNMDETAFFFCSAPSRTISTERIAGRKQIKKRLTVAVCSNADGTTKLPLLFVGAVQKPRCFLGKSAAELGLQYERTAKGWMTSRLFEQWLSEFDSQMRVEKRRVLLLVDNVSSHKASADLTNVTLQMLPPNTTSFLQPQDAGIIAAFKARIRKMQQRRVVDLFDELLSQEDDIGEKDVDALFNVDVLTAMRWAEEAWHEVSSEAITRCWQHTQILDEEMFELVENFKKLRAGQLSLQQLLS